MPELPISGALQESADSLCSDYSQLRAFYRRSGRMDSLALAVMISGNWTPLNVALGGILFGLFKCIAATYSNLTSTATEYMLAELGISPYVYRLLPYLITLIVLAFTFQEIESA